MKPPVILTVAGSDSGGGAGIQADIRTISMLGCFPVTALTALTAQNSTGVHEVHTPPPSFVAAQMDAVLGDLRPAAAKTGMLATAEIVSVVAGRLRGSMAGRLVVDPVMVSTTGHRLIDESAVRVLVERLFPLAQIVTPNLLEASALLGRPIARQDEMAEAARAIHAMGPRAVLLKGGHLSASAADYFYDGREGEFVTAERVRTANTHGSGCTLAAALASLLGRGLGLRESVHRAKAFITRAIRESFRVGEGPGPVNPMAGGVVDR